MTDYYSAKHWAEKARKHAVGNSTENPGGSAKYWAEKAEAAAETASLNVTYEASTKTLIMGGNA